MTAPGAASSASSDAVAAQAAWRSVRDSSDIQFAPLAPDPPRETPEWLKWLGEWLEWLLGPLGRLLGSGWGIVEMLLLAGAAIGAVWIAWSLLWPMWIASRMRQKVAPPAWTPHREDALVLLKDADHLAAEGLFGEAAHLLLQRSVGQIARARPDWLTPASTAREIGAIHGLSAEARTAFGTIAALVERARYALRPLGAEDWSIARAAYASFALEPLGSGS